MHYSSYQVLTVCQQLRLMGDGVKDESMVMTQSDPVGFFFNNNLFQ